RDGRPVDLYRNPLCSRPLFQRFQQLRLQRLKAHSTGTPLAQALSFPVSPCVAASSVMHVSPYRVLILAWQSHLPITVTTAVRWRGRMSYPSGRSVATYPKIASSSSSTRLLWRISWELAESRWAARPRLR